MKKPVYKCLTFIFIFFFYNFCSPSSFPHDNPQDKFKDKPYFIEIEKPRLKEKNEIFNLDLDIQVGVTISKTNFDVNSADTSAAALNNTGTKVGPSIGAILSFNFLGFGFTTGIQYTNKGFKTTSGDKMDLNYFNIPLLLYFGFDFDKVIIDGNLGPYFGILFSQDESTLYKVKNFDLGLTGSIQGAYMFQKFLGALLGLKYEYGGLNNLGNNNSINSIRTSTFYIYSGIKFVL